MTNYFDLYQIPISFYPEQDIIKKKFYELSRLYHPDRFASTGGEELSNALSMAAINNEAYKTLKSTDATMHYILLIKNIIEQDEKYNLPPAFLMEMMDINEAISDYEQEPDNKNLLTQATENLNEQLEQWKTEVDKKIQLFEKDTDHKILIQIKDFYFRKKYLLRIKERIDTFAAQ